MNDQPNSKPAFDAEILKKAVKKHLIPPSAAFDEFLDRDALAALFHSPVNSGLTNRMMLQATKIDEDTARILFKIAYMDALHRMMNVMETISPEAKHLADTLARSENITPGHA